MAGKLQSAHSGLIWGRRTCTLKFSSEETSIERKVVCRDHRPSKPRAKFLGDVFECGSALEVGSSDAVNMGGAWVAAGIDKC